MIIKHLSGGLSLQTFGGVVGVARSTVYKWIDDIPEFKKAKDIGVQRAQDFFEKRLLAKVAGQDLSHKGIDSKKIDTTALIFALKTRFHETYGEKKDVNVEVGPKTEKLVIDLSDD
jgi:predicted DNA-binding transcriptional regulator AlpA